MSKRIKTTKASQRASNLKKIMLHIKFKPSWIRYHASACFARWSSRLKIKPIAKPIKAYSIGQTIPNTWPGGDNGGFVSWVYTLPILPANKLLKYPTNSVPMINSTTEIILFFLLSKNITPLGYFIPG